MMEKREQVLLLGVRSLSLWCVCTCVAYVYTLLYISGFFYMAHVHVYLLSGTFEISIVASHYKPHISLDSNAFCLLNGDVLGDANSAHPMHSVQAITLNKLWLSVAKQYVYFHSGLITGAEVK